MPSSYSHLHGRQSSHTSGTPHRTGHDWKPFSTHDLAIKQRRSLQGANEERIGRVAGYSTTSGQLGVTGARELSSDPSHAPEPLLTCFTGYSKSAGAARSPPRARFPPTTLTWTWTGLGGERRRRSCASTSWSRGLDLESSGWWSVRDWGGCRLAAGEARAAGAGSGPRSESHQVLAREQQRRRGRGSCSHTQILRSTGSLLASGSPPV